MIVDLLESTDLAIVDVNQASQVSQRYLLAHLSR